jgi:hypothetical protein
VSILDTQIRELAVDVDDQLRRYVAIHDDFFAFALRRLVPLPGVFESINIKRHFIDLGGIEMRLNAMLAKASYLSPKLFGAEKDYVDALVSYLTLLHDAVSKFTQIMNSLSRKISGEKRYGWFAYRQDVKEYERLVKNYSAMGKELNEKWRRLRGSF